MQEYEKNFLETIADAIPGVKGYRDKEARRDTDKRLRDYMASELDRQRRGMDGAKRDLMSRGQLTVLADVDRIAGKMQKAGDMLRFASYGYAGLFDSVKVREAELDKLYQHDLDAFRDVRGLGEQIAGMAAAGDAAAAARELEGAVDALLTRIEERKKLFDAPV